MSENSIELLKSFSLFQNLSDEELKAVNQLAIQRTYPQGTHIFMQDEPLANVYFIHKGKVKIYRTDLQGKEQIMNILQDGEMFPHQGFFRSGNYPAHALSMESCSLIFIPIHSFEKFLLTQPEVCVKIFRVMGDKIVDLQNRLEEKLLRNTREQIILLLLRIAKRHGEKLDDEKVLINTHFTNQELANMIGTARETINRTLTKLKKKNLIETDSTGCLVIHPDKLKDELI